MFHKAFKRDINYISFRIIYMNELVPCTFLNRHKVKMRHRLDFSRIHHLTQNKPWLLSKFQFHSLNKSCIKKINCTTCQRLQSSLLVFVGTTIRWKTVAKKQKTVQNLLRFSSKRRNQTYIIAGNTADTWRETSSKNLKMNQKIN